MLKGKTAIVTGSARGIGKAIALKLASLGANVLHNRSVELGKKYNVNICVRSSLTRAEGTICKHCAY